MTNNEHSSIEGASGDGLGGRLPLLSPEDLNDDQRALYDRFQKAQMPWAAKAGFEAQLPDGRLIGPFNAYLHTPGITNAFLDWGEAQSKQSGLSEEIRQIVILTVGVAWNADYEIYAHAAVARAAGMSRAAIEAIKANREPADVTPAALAAYRLISVLVRTQEVPDDLYTEATTMLGSAGVIGALQLAGQYMTVSAILKTFRVPVPMRSQA